MNLGSLPLTTASGSPFAQLSHLCTLGKGQVGEWPATIQGTKGNVAVRVCAYRKTDEQRLESERKLKRDVQRRQKQLQTETIEAMDYVVIVTTFTCLNAEDILALYRHCWQVELAFIRMKSLLGLSRLRKKDPAGAQAWLQGKLLVACLIERLITVGEHFSPVGHEEHERESNATPLSLA
jgi:hypothetical protein